MTMPDVSEQQNNASQTSSDVMPPVASILVVPYGKIVEKRGASYTQQLFHQGITAQFTAEVLTETLDTIATLLQDDRASVDLGSAILGSVDKIYGVTPEQVREKRFSYLRELREKGVIDSTLAAALADLMPQPTADELQHYVRDLTPRDYLLLCYVAKHGANTMTRADPSQSGLIQHFLRLSKYAPGGLEGLLPSDNQ